MRRSQIACAFLLLLAGSAPATRADDVAGVSSVSVASASLLTLDVENAELAAVLDAIREQTGNRVEDYRQRFNQRAEPVRVSTSLDKVPFWPAMDALLDQAGLAPYHYSDAGVLAISNRPPGTPPRTGRAAYSGPFRLEVLQVSAVRNLGSPDENGLYAQMVIAWEPRLEPIGIVQPGDDITVTGNDGVAMALKEPEATTNIDISPGDSKAELAVAVRLPDRAAVQTATIAGTMHALVPRRAAKFKFENLDIGGVDQQSDGGVDVSLDQVVEKDGLWEFHMRLRVQDDLAGLAALRGWVFQNTTYLVDAKERTLDHVGFETSTATDKEVGLVYLFEIPEDWSDYAWVYETPVDITSVPVQYELKDVPLP